jgi:hypothetical protein
MLPVKSPRRSARQRLVGLYDALGAQDRATLTAFAEFLAARQAAAAEPLAQPTLLPRPAQESVVAAIRRLAQGYHMLDRAAMLHETSALMSAHILQGRPADEVIDELEALFLRHYDRHRTERGA